MVQLPTWAKNMEIKTKKQIRAEVKKYRNESSVESIFENSQKICEQFLDLSEYRKASTIFAYMDCKNEVQTRSIIEQCWNDGKSVAVPKVFGEQMKFYQIFSYDDLEDGYFGIQEPKHENLNEIICEDGLMILPGVAFDEKRHRIGYGGGFYDRYLELHPGMKKIALAFEFQIYDSVPFEVFDQQPEKIITETRIIV